MRELLADFRAAFTEWERRYREDPAKFTTDYEKAAQGLDEYGERAAAYFAELLAELGR